jgi:lipopolysaccharide biosynthesis glycosyltransferase
MNCAVVTLCIGEESSSVAELTHPTIKAYAAKLDADFVVIETGIPSSLSPHWAKFKLYDLLNKYDRIIYMDTDLIVRDDCPNLFNTVPYSQMGAFNEATFMPREYSLIETAQAYGVDWEKLKWNGKYYNTGVLVFSKCHRNLFKKPDLEFSNYYEQSYLNLKIAQEESTKTKEDKSLMFDLSYRFNRMTCLDFAGEDRHASFILHYAGYKYTIDVAAIREIIKNDLEKWKNDSPKYEYKRHILVIVAGGLGDQVDAEPCIRFLENIYKDADINITTHWPRLFKHLKYPAYVHKDFMGKRDTPYFQMPTFPDPTTVMYTVVSNLMCHTVDYCSMATLHRTLPLKDKIIKLSIDKHDDDELDSVLNGFDLTKAVLIHPGRHWESKSFPQEWWQDLVNKISAEVPVCLIGTDNHENRGAYQLDLPSNSFSLIDRTSIGSLISAVARSPVLVSNDSGPVHIAGAFNNWIVLIPSCKHPDHVLPFRINEMGEVSNYHKAFALYKKLTLDDCDQRPTTWIDGGSSAENQSGSWENYLPSTDEVYKRALSCFYTIS